MFNGLVKDSVALYAGVKMIKKSKKRTVESEGFFTEEFKAALVATLKEKAEAYAVRKTFEAEGRKIKVTK